YVLQLIPCGILRPKQHAVIGAGVVIDPAALVAEIETLAQAGVDVKGRLHISNRAHLIFPYHRELDLAAESARGANKIGTTSRGIGPAYEDKMARRGLRVVDLLDPALFREKANRVVAEKNRIAQGAYGAHIDFSHEVDATLALGEKIKSFICDTAELINRALDEGKSVLFEGAQGTMLDIDHGTYPFVTSSSATAGGVATGAGVPPTKIQHVLGISKAYTTRVGGGPFPTEMPDLEAKEVRERGKEFGAVTGRPRRCGWLDLAELRYAKMINGIDSLAVTKLDVFDTQREIKVGLGYTYKGSPIHEMPASAEEYERVVPVYKTLPGWCQHTYGIKEDGQLPKAAIDYLRFVSEFLQVEIGMISTGPERDATIIPPGTLLSRWL
ncbi:MAG: adenylosuccinate synthase, partial [Candidatus Acidiferrum sp.]